MPTTEPRHQGGSPNEPWQLRLYIAGWTPASVAALRTVKALEAEYFPPGSTVEVIDLVERPEAGVEDNVLAIPTLVKMRPDPMRRNKARSRRPDPKTSPRLGRSWRLLHPLHSWM